MTAFNDIREKIIRLCQGEMAIKAAYIFGSFPRQVDKEPEDIDIAILVDNDQLGTFSVPSFISLLEKILHYRVDLVLLNRAGEVLKYEVRRTGKLIFERSPDIGKRFEISSRKTYEDFLFLHKKYVSNVLYGGTSGK